MRTALVTIIIFLVMISLHEFGHFITAKLCGVKVLEFAIGMGPAIFKKKGKETLYSLRIIPVGGYCRLDGENEETDDEKAFCNQKLWKRFLVIVAGATLNIILGFCVLFSYISYENEIPTTEIGSVIEESYLADADIREGDVIVGINGKHIGFYQDIAFYTDGLNDKESIEIAVKRDGKVIKQEIKPSISEHSVEYKENGAHITEKINGKNYIDEDYEYKDKSKVKDMIGKTETDTRYLIGFSPKSVKTNFINKLEYSWHYTWFVVKLVYKGLIDLVTGKAGVEQVSGPIGVVDAVNTAVNSGALWIRNVLFLVGLLTINLGVFNLLPLPALDGGRLFFMLIELIRGKPVPQDKEGLVHGIGLALLLALSVVISFKDIIMLIKV